MHYTRLLLCHLSWAVCPATTPSGRGQGRAAPWKCFPGATASSCSTSCQHEGAVTRPQASQRRHHTPPHFLCWSHQQSGVYKSQICTRVLNLKESNHRENLKVTMEKKTKMWITVEIWLLVGRNQQPSLTTISWVQLCCFIRFLFFPLPFLLFLLFRPAIVN